MDVGRQLDAEEAGRVRNAAVGVIGELGQLHVAGYKHAMVRVQFVRSQSVMLRSAYLVDVNCIDFRSGKARVVKHRYLGL